MPRFPDLARRSGLIGASVFEKYRERLRAAGPDYIKLHIGDRAGPLPYETPFDDGWLDEHPHVLQYCNTFGISSLRDAVADKLREDNALALEASEFMITAGASNALSVGCQAILEPGDGILILTPAWPFFAGMARLAGATVRELPFYDRLYAQPDLDLDAAIEAALNPNTVALYVNTPNNPSGKVLSRAQLETIAALARERNLWVISDEAYDGLVFDGLEHVSLASLPGMRERTLSTFSCSKSFAFAGIRLGWLVAAPEVVAAANKLMVHQFYGPNTPGQAMLATAIRQRKQWMPGMVADYQRQRDRFLDALGIDVPRPEGSYFAFFDTRGLRGERSMDDLVGACLDAGVSVTPGGDFGGDYEEFLRLCYTADTPERAQEGARRIGEILRA